MSTVATWPNQAETWLDARGKGAWIVATILGFIVFWPAGLALLAYMIWSKRMFSNSTSRPSHRRSMMCNRSAARAAFKTSGNVAFDAYKSETLRRLEEEQENFENFLQRLRESKDKSEFDQFMEERASKARDVDPETDIDDDKPAA